MPWSGEQYARRPRANRLIASSKTSCRRCLRRFSGLHNWKKYASEFRKCRLPASHPGLTGRDWQGAVGVFALVVAATFPVVIPFAVIDDVRVALRISNVLAVVSLFLCGFLFGKHAGLPPWLTGLVMVVVGVALVAIAIALGG